MGLQRQLKKHFKLFPDDHVFFFTSLFLLILAILYFLPWLLVFVYGNFVYGLAAYVGLPLPVTTQYTMNQANALGSTLGGAYNQDVVPFANQVLDCIDGLRVLYNAVTAIIRGMLHVIALRFTPINRATLLTVMTNVLNIALNFAIALLTFLLNLLQAVLDLFSGKGFNFDFAVAIVNFILSDLLDVIDDPPCWHPLSEEPGLFIQCITNGRLNKTDVNNAGFVGFVEGLVIALCGFGNFSVDFVDDILLPCTGLDQFFIFKTIYFEIAGNVTVMYYHDLDQFNQDLAAFNNMKDAVANLGQAIVNYLIRKVCGGVKFFCTIIKGIGIANGKIQHRLENFDSSIHGRGIESILGVCVYDGSSTGKLIGCYYTDPTNFHLSNPDGSIMDTSIIDRTFNNILTALKTTFPQILSQLDHSNVPTYVPSRSMRQTIDDIHTKRIHPSVIFNRADSIKKIATSPQNPFRQGQQSFKGTTTSESFKRQMTQQRSRLDANYAKAKSKINSMLEDSAKGLSTANVLLTALHHGMKALKVGTNALLNHRNISNVYWHVRDGLDEIGFDFNEVIDTLDAHVVAHHPTLQKSGFNLALNMQGFLTSVILTGIQGMTSIFLTVVSTILGVGGYMAALLGSVGGLLNYLSGTTTHFDFGLNFALQPLVDWTAKVNSGIPVTSAETEQIAELIVSKLPVLIEQYVLQVVRVAAMCNFPYPGICPPPISTAIEANTEFLDITVDYILNVTACSPDLCTGDETDMYGNPCVDGTIYCWFDAPKIRLPYINFEITPNTKQCLYNGTSFNENLPYLTVVGNWLRYTYSDGLQFILRVGVRGYSISVLLIPIAYVFGKVCFCLGTPMHVFIWVILLQYPTVVLHYLPDAYPTWLYGHDAFVSYVTFPSGDITSDDLFCFVTGLPTFFFGYVITYIIVALVLTIIVEGVLLSLIMDAWFIIKFNASLLNEAILHYTPRTQIVRKVHFKLE